MTKTDNIDKKFVHWYDSVLPDPPAGWRIEDECEVQLRRVLDARATFSALAQENTGSSGRALRVVANRLPRTAVLWAKFYLGLEDEEQWPVGVPDDDFVGEDPEKFFRRYSDDLADNGYRVFTWSARLGVTKRADKQRMNKVGYWLNKEATDLEVADARFRVFTFDLASEMKVWYSYS